MLGYSKEPKGRVGGMLLGVVQGCCSPSVSSLAGLAKSPLFCCAWVCVQLVILMTSQGGGMAT